MGKQKKAKQARREVLEHVPWTPFKQAADLPEWAQERPGETVWLNTSYQVVVGPFMDPNFGRMVHLSIKRRDRRIMRDWRELQRIKNEMGFTECDAVEVFPSESKLIDTSNQYHLWVFLDFKLSFGYTQRLVTEAKSTGIGKFAKQRPFPDDAKPADLVGGEELDKLGAEYVKLRSEGKY